MDGTIGTIPLTGVDAFGVRWILDRKGVQGWGAPAGTLAPKPKTRQMGAWGGLSYGKQRPLVLAGACIAPTEALAGDAENRFIDQCSLDDSVLTVTRAGISRWSTVRRDGEIDPVWANPFSFDWSVQFVAVDPRKFGTPITASTGLPSSSGGLTIPYVIPYTISGVQTSGQVSIFNPGNETGPVVMRLDGPCVGPIITHVGSGLSLVFAASLTLGAGEWLDIVMEDHSVLANGGPTRAQFITSRQWSGLEPGSNTWSFTAASYSAGALLTVTGTPCDK